MRRTQLIEKLMSEGFSEKTLVKFNDNQLEKFAKKILGEQTLNIPKDNKVAIDTAKKTKQTFVTYEENDIEEKKGKENWIQKATDPKKKGQLHKDLGVPEDEVIPVSKLKAAAKKKGKVGQRARMALNLKNLNEFVDNAVGSTYHTLVTKGDMVSLIKERINESNFDLSEKKEPAIPEFMSFNSIVSAGEKEAPEKESPEVDTPPVEKPGVDTPERDPRRNPFRNPDEQPVVDPRPKAKIKKLASMPMAAE